jgi:hypothetical protein
MSSYLLEICRYFYWIDQHLRKSRTLLRRYCKEQGLGWRDYLGVNHPNVWYVSIPEV